MSRSTDVHAAEQPTGRRINRGPWLTDYTWLRLQNQHVATPVVLPICPLGTPPQRLTELGPLVLPPLFHEALDSDLRHALVARIRQCFPAHERSPRRAAATTLEVVDLPGPCEPAPFPPPRVLALSIDTAVEEHGPHLPLATDRLQSMAVLDRLAREQVGLRIAWPLDYGQLAWALPIGWSVDLTADLTARYVTGYVNALVDWLRPAAVYAVCVHGSRIHHEAIRAGLSRSRAGHWRFRWLHEPLVDLAWSRGDAHAGGVETALIAHLHPDLVDSSWWPGRADDLGRGQMSLQDALRAAANLDQWIEQADLSRWNGIVGCIEHFPGLDAAALFATMLDVARRDVNELIVETRPQATP